MADAERDLRRLQSSQAEFRAPPDHTAADTFQRLAADAERVHKQLGALTRAWVELVPEDLRDRTSLAGLRRGVLTVEADDSGTLYELDRLLRGGLDHRLIGAVRSGPAFRRIKLRLADGAG